MYFFIYEKIPTCMRLYQYIALSKINKEITFYILMFKIWILTNFSLFWYSILCICFTILLIVFTLIEKFYTFNSHIKFDAIMEWTHYMKKCKKLYMCINKIHTWKFYKFKSFLILVDLFVRLAYILKFFWFFIIILSMIDFWDCS